MGILGFEWIWGSGAARAAGAAGLGSSKPGGSEPIARSCVWFRLRVCVCVCVCVVKAASPDGMGVDCGSCCSGSVPRTAHDVDQSHSGWVESRPWMDGSRHGNEGL